MIKKNNFFKKVLVFCLVSCFCAFCFAQETSASSLFAKGLSSQNDESWYEASQFFMEALQKNPAYGDAWFHLAQCSYQLGEYDLVFDQLEQAEKYARDENSVQNLRGMTYVASGNFNEARSVFEKILSHTPNDVDSRFGLAELDLFDGKVTGAEKQYLEALKRQRGNRKALLSLALVSAQLKKFDNAQNYIKQALSLYSNEAEVHYIAAVIHSMQGNIKNAELQCRIAVEVDGNYEKAYELLAKIRYAQKYYDDVVSLCDFLISRNRNNSTAWYLKGAALLQKNDESSAISTWTSGLEVFPQNEVMRTALELSVSKSVPLEDSRRKKWSQYHIQTAREYLRRYDSPGAIYEYQRALKIEPSNEEARMAFANMLELNGMHELYLDQLLFIRQNRTDSESNTQTEKTRSQVQMDDRIEAYENLLESSLSKKWNVQPFYLEKTRWNIGIYYESSSIGKLHVESNKIAADFASDIFTGITSEPVKTQVAQINGFGRAYQNARALKQDYFIILSVDEGVRDVVLEYTLYSARTGTKLREDSLYGTGNNKYSRVFRRFRQQVLEMLPIRAVILNRDGKTLLSDIGRSENITEGAVFDIVRKNAVQTASRSSGVSYSESDVLGTFTVTTAGEEISEGELEYKGFYDRVNTGDELVLVSLPKKEENTSANPNVAPEADGQGNVAVSESSSPGLTAEDLGIRRAPSVIDMIRSIY